MSHNYSFGNESTINPLNVDSPVVRDRFSRFSRLAESFNVSRLGTSMLATSPSLLNESATNTSTHLFTDLANISDVSSTHINLNPTLQLDNSPLSVGGGGGSVLAEADAPDTDDMARMAIFESFYELNQKLPKADETFDLLIEFDHTCDVNLHASREMLDSKVRPDSEAAYLSKFSSLIRLERNTWRLLAALYHDRLRNTIEDEETAGPGTLNLSGDVECMEVEEDLHIRLSDMELAERALKRNATLREMQIVIDWLESVYDEEPLDKVEFYSDGPNYWENTLHSLKVSTRGPKGLTPLAALGKGRQYCTQMDPDASIRTAMSLHDLDKEDENRLFHYLFKLVRAGQLQEGKEIAEKQGYFWLSAALEGWLLHHDPNYKPENTEPHENGFEMINFPGSPRSLATTAASIASTTAIKHLHPVIGNPYRDLWKHTAWQCSKIEGTNLFERAIFAVFSGNRSILLPLCTKWLDKLWAYYKCSLDAHLENLLVDSNIPKPDQQPRNSIELPPTYWDAKLLPEEIFAELASASHKGDHGSSSVLGTLMEEEYHQAVERFIILNKTDELIDQVYEWSKAIAAKREARAKNLNSMTTSTNNNKAREEEIAKVVEPNLLRFFAHLVIALRNLGLVVDERHGEFCNEILETYIGFLIEYKLIELVAFYTLNLPEARQVKMFANLLEGIDDETDRRMCLLVAKQSRLNLPAILATVVENIRTDNLSYQTKPASGFGGQQSQPKTGSGGGLIKLPQIQLTSSITEEDLRKIASLDWLQLDAQTAQYIELVWQGNALLRTFLLEQKLDQAKAAFAKMPADIVACAFEEWKTVMKLNGGSSGEVLDIDNVIREYICYKTFFEAHDSFQKWYHYLHNSKPREPTRPKTMTRLGDRVAYEQAVKQYEQEMTEWRHQIVNQAAITSEKLIAFLRFPEGIWVNVDDLKLMAELAEDIDEAEAGETDLGVPSLRLATPTIGDDGDLVDLELGEDAEIQSTDLVNSVATRALLERKRADWTLRTVQLEGLRRIYVPQFIFLLHSVYADSGSLPQCLQIADIVADERSRLYATFTAEQMGDLLSKLREVAIEILNTAADPLGYSGAV